MIEKYQKSNKTLSYQIVLVAVVIIAALFFYYQWQISRAAGVDESDILFSIDKGMSVNQIANDLSNDGIIVSSFWFKFYLRINGFAGQIQAGDHYLKNSMNIKTIVASLITKTQKKEKKLTFIEGWSIIDIEKYLIEQGMTTTAEWRVALEKDYNYEWLPPIGEDYLEGYLFPDTYRVYTNASAEDIINKMLDNFDKKVTVEFRNRAIELNRSLADIITMASIVEKEVHLYEDRAMVADIFWRRFDDNYPLQSDATVNYITKSGRTQSTTKETQIDNPYNTYKYAGLPPRPICNPSLEAIKATLYPEANDYYFFLTTKHEGAVVFSRNYDEHLLNKAKYLD